MSFSYAPHFLSPLPKLSLLFFLATSPFFFVHHALQSDCDTILVLNLIIFVDSTEQWTRTESFSQQDSRITLAYYGSERRFGGQECCTKSEENFLIFTQIK